MICDFCFRKCDIGKGGTGYCKMRKEENGVIVSPSYAHVPSMAIDPIEKKPLYHFMPGTKTLSFGLAGCSLSCSFCQNWELSQRQLDGPFVRPEEFTLYAEAKNIPSISFTYSEPLVWQDYMLDVAYYAKEGGIKTIMVTSGVFSSTSLSRILPFIDAYNIDLKGDDEFYINYSKGKIKPVLDGIERIAREGKHLEVTTLIIEGIHDEKMIRGLGKELKERGVNVWHLTRFFPAYRMAGRKETSECYLLQMLEVASLSGIFHIYPGNSSLSTPLICPRCKEKSDGLRIGKDGKGYCKRCNERIYGLWA